MTYTAVVIVVISSFIHACWNLIGKRGNPSARFFLLANALGCACLTPVLITHIGAVSRFPSSIWLLLLMTGFFQAVYYGGLAGAYKAGHFSITYPLARSIPVISVAVVTLLLGMGRPLGLQSIVGMGLIAVGGFLLPITKFSDWKLRDYLHPSNLFALLAAFGTTGYSIVDDSALRVLKGMAELHTSRPTLALIYASLEGISSSLWLLMFVLMGRSKRSDSAAKSDSIGIGSAALAGIGIFLAYSLVLLAMTFASNVSYIVAFRQLSIPIGAVLGMTLLREPRYNAKLIGIVIMLAGLVLVAVAR